MYKQTKTSCLIKQIIELAKKITKNYIGYFFIQVNIEVTRDHQRWIVRLRNISEPGLTFGITIARKKAKTNIYFGIFTCAPLGYLAERAPLGGGGRHCPPPFLTQNAWP